MDTYLCEKCKSRVASVDGKLIRKCGHVDAKVVADMAAVVTSGGEMTALPRKR